MDAKPEGSEAKVSISLSDRKDSQEPNSNSGMSPSCSCCGKEGCRQRSCVSSVAEGMTHLVPESVVENMLKGVVESTLKANAELTTECSRRWLDEEKLRLSQLNLRVQMAARCFCVTVLALALVLMSYNLKGCANARGRSPSRAEVANPVLVSATNQVQVTSINSISSDK